VPPPVRRPTATLVRGDRPADDEQESGQQLLRSLPDGTSQHPAPAWVRNRHKPVYTLQDFLRRSPHTHLPPRSIMLTIDDGPSPEWTPKFLRLFAKHDVKATFCMIGPQVRPNRHIVKDLVRDGHHVANHTWTHDEALPTRSAARIRRELHDTSDAIVRASGFVPRQFRAPGGVWGPKVFSAVAAAGMLPLGWDVDPRDWARPGTGAITSALLLAGPGDILLCHDGGGDREQTYAALQRVVPRLRSEGYHFITLPAPHTI
jgi:peptidoglycan/xylan/chitin deacetylase (PgdA/CDA1 family)